MLEKDQNPQSSDAEKGNFMLNKSEKPNSRSNYLSRQVFDKLTSNYTVQFSSHLEVNKILNNCEVLCLLGINVNSNTHLYRPTKEGKTWLS